MSISTIAVTTRFGAAQVAMISANADAGARRTRAARHLLARSDRLVAALEELNLADAATVPELLLDELGALAAVTGSGPVPARLTPTAALDRLFAIQSVIISVPEDDAEAA